MTPKNKSVRIYSTIFIIVNLFLSIVLIMSNTADAADTDYYISNDGDDSNSGTSPSQAWKTTSKLNNELKSTGVINDGDDIYFRRGDTFNLGTDYIGLRTTDGTATDPMIFGAYGSGPDPILTCNAAMGNPFFYFMNSNIGNWIFENLTFRLAAGMTGAHNFFAGNTGNKHNLIIRHCTFDGNNYGANGNKANLLYYNLENYLIEYCTLIDTGHYIYGDGAGGKPNSNTIMRHCTIDAKGGNQDNYQLHCEYQDNSGNAENHLIYDVISTNTTSNAFDIVGGWENPYHCENILIRDCVGKVLGNNPPIVIGHGVANTTLENSYFEGSLYLTRSRNTIVRNCVFKQDAGGYAISQDDPQWDFGWGTVDCTLYHNTIIADGTTRYVHANVGATGTENLDGFRFKNNIFYTDDDPTMFVLYSDGNPGVWNLEDTDSYYSYNMWWRSDGDMTNRWVLEDGTYSLSSWNALNRVSNELGADADLVNPTGTNFPSDFELNSNSPAIDAGGWLTTTNGGGTGTTITVNEANFFFPGISDLGVPGDNIFIGDDTDLEIIAINYAAETITVDKSITWSNGEPVSLSSYSGSAPDIGAIESAYSGSEPSAPEISNVLLTESDPLDTNPTYGWIKITSDITSDAGIDYVDLVITYPDSSSVTVSMNEGGSNSYYYYTNTIFTDFGDYSYYIQAVDLNGNQSTSSVYDFSMPPNWDIDKDGVCNVLDLLLISNHYDETGQNGWIREDVDNNGIIQVIDFVLVSDYYSETW